MKNSQKGSIKSVGCILVCILLVGVGVYLYSQKKAVEETAAQLRNISYMDNQYPLKDGVYSWDCPWGEKMCSGEVFSVTLTQSVLVDLNKDGARDAVVALNRSQGYGDGTLSSSGRDVISAVINNSGQFISTEPFEIVYELQIVAADVVALSAGEDGQVVVSIMKKDTMQSSPVAQDITLRFDQQSQKLVRVQ